MRTKTSITIAKLDDGRKVRYDNCSKSKDSVNTDNFVFIGRGVIYKVNGVIQNSTKKMFFYEKTF